MVKSICSICKFIIKWWCDSTKRIFRL